MSVEIEPSRGAGNRPVCLIKDDDLVSTGWQSHFLLSEGFDLVSDDVYTSVARQKCHKKDWMSKYRSSDAFSSNTPSLYASPRSWWAKQ